MAGVGQATMRKAESEDLDFESEGGAAVTLHWGENQELLGLGWKRSVGSAALPAVSTGTRQLRER